MIPTLYVDSEDQAGHQVCTASIYHLSYVPSPLAILFFCIRITGVGSDMAHFVKA